MLCMCYQYVACFRKASLSYVYVRITYYLQNVKLILEDSMAAMHAKDS